MIALGNDDLHLVVMGDTYDDSFRAACGVAEGLGLAMVPAFDHPWTIAGQGTVAQEIVEQLGEALAASAIGAWMPEPGQTVVAILSGGNNDVSRYAEIIERLLVYEGRKHYFLLNFP